MAIASQPCLCLSSAAPGAPAWPPHPAPMIARPAGAPRHSRAPLLPSTRGLRARRPARARDHARADRHVPRPQRIVRVAGRQALGRWGARVDPDLTGTPIAAAGTAVRRNHMLHGADGEARVREIEIFAANAQSAAELTRAAGVGDELEADESGGKFALYDFDRRDLGVALVDSDAGRAVLARARAGAAGEDLVLHIALAGIGVAAAEDDGAAATAVGADLARNHTAHGGEDRVHQRMDGGIVGVDRRGKARIEYAALARGHGEAAGEAA